MDFLEFYKKYINQFLLTTGFETEVCSNCGRVSAINTKDDSYMCLNCGTIFNDKCKLEHSGVFLCEYDSKIVFVPILKDFKEACKMLRNTCNETLDCNYEDLDACIMHKLKDDGSYITIDFTDML